MKSVRVIREEAEQEQTAQTDPIVHELSQIIQTQILITDVRGVELSIPVESLSRVFQSYHEKFDTNIKQISQKQQAIIKQLRTLEIDGNIGKPDVQSNRIFKKMDEFQEIRHETQKYKALVGMMKNTLNKLEDSIDEMIDKKLAEIASKDK